MEIIDGIKADLTANNLSAWPDIEILPNITIDQDESEATKGYTKRRAGKSQSRINEDSTSP